MPAQSTIVIPIRFGFSQNTPSKWRNLATTKEKLSNHNVTVSFSNSKSTSGNLVVAGFILLKAPMTTHRLRYLQALRRMLDTQVPPFDILLHKRTPSDQLIPHLAVQCGTKHVHAVCESLAPLLTGNGSALFIPRFSLSQMTEPEVATLFNTHDAYVKSLRWLSLSPLLSNLDRPRKEHQPDGSVTQRTTREWARSITTLDGKELAQCDVVNGGSDQLCYLLFPPQNQAAAQHALDEYRKRLYPFSQREAQFRESIGPSSQIHFSKPVIANLDFIKRLSLTSPQPNSNPDPSSGSTTGTNWTDDSRASEITEDVSTSALRPPTPAESLRQRYRQQNAVFDEDDDSTTASTASNSSKLSAGRMSTSSAKLRELHTFLDRQKKTQEKKDEKNSERIAFIERQLHRLDDLDLKLSEVKTDFGTRLNLFEDRISESVHQQAAASNQSLSHLNATLQQLMSAVSTLSTNVNKGASSNQSNSSSGSSMSAESAGLIQSPEHKRHRSAKKPLKESIRRFLDTELQAASHISPNIASTQDESFDSLDVAMQQIDMIALAQQQPNSSSSDIHIPESQNTESSIVSAEHHSSTSTHAPESQNTAGSDKTDEHATPSRGRAPSL